MKFFYKTISSTKLKSTWSPRFLLIQEKIDRGETIEEDDVTPELALAYVAIVNKRVPEVEQIIIAGSPDIRSDYIKLLKLIRDSKTLK